MKNEEKRYRVQIFGDDYTLISDEPENRVVQAADMVDALMGEIAQKTNTVTPKKMAVLVALRIASNLLNQQQILEENNRKKVVLIDHIEQELLLHGS